MKIFILPFIDFAYSLLAVPRLASISLREMPARDRFATLWAALAALSLSTGLFYLRASYSASFFVFIPLLAGVIFFFNRFYSRLLCARVLASPLPERAERRILPSLMEGSCLPGVFSLPLSISAREFSHPGLLLLPGLLAITVWVLYIQYTGLVYSLELDRRRSMSLLVRNHLMLLVFPVVSLYFFGAILVSVIGVRSVF